MEGEMPFLLYMIKQNNNIILDTLLTAAGQGWSQRSATRGEASPSPLYAPRSPAGPQLLPTLMGRRNRFREFSKSDNKNLGSLWVQSVTQLQIHIALTSLDLTPLASSYTLWWRDVSTLLSLPFLSLFSQTWSACDTCGTYDRPLQESKCTCEQHQVSNWNHFTAVVQNGWAQAHGDKGKKCGGKILTTVLTVCFDKFL